jgi:hypothetical protein
VLNAAWSICRLRTDVVALMLVQPRHTWLPAPEEKRGRRWWQWALREVLGNPFRPPALDPAWVHADGGALLRLASSIYGGQSFADLPILADALEEAGCQSADVLGHLRGGGLHVRGCWALDAVMGRG